jgi:hypothetical protein
MSGVEPESPAHHLVARALNLLLHPQEAWETIAAEPATVEGLYKAWVLPLAAVPAVARLIGLMSFGGIEIFGIRYQPGFVAILGDAVASYALTLISVYLLALVIDQFAHQFGGERNRMQAFKVAAYSGTAAWLAGVFLLLPAQGGLLALIGAFYSLYLLYQGLPRLMRSNPQLNLNYFAVVLVAVCIMALIIGSVTSRVTNFGGPVRIG